MTNKANPSLAAKTLLVAFLAIASSDSSAFAAKTGRSIDTPASSYFYEDALKWFHASDYRAAVIQLKNALQQNPRDLPARILLGRTLKGNHQTKSHLRDISCKLSCAPQGADIVRGGIKTPKEF